MALSSAGDVGRGGSPRQRGDIPVQLTWDLRPVYPDDMAWETAWESLRRRLTEFAPFRGHLGDSPETLGCCLDLLSEIQKEFARLYSYASMRSDEDTRDSRAFALEQKALQLGAEVAAAVSFVDPEILQLEPSTVGSWLASVERLAVYRQTVRDTLRRRDHTGNDGEERILAHAGLVADGPHSVYGVFSDADFPFPTVRLASGSDVRLDKSAFSLHRASPNREDRKAVFSAYFGALAEFRRTFGAQLFAEVKKNIFYARARRYPTCLARALDGNNIPEAVYRGLIANVRDSLETFHRYLALRQRILGVESLHAYDLYAPIVPAVDLEYRFEEAWTLVLDSLRPLGDDYVAIARKASGGRWIDVLPSEGKRSGAYSNGAVYDVHPYILLNYNGKFDDVSTLTHELGHTMHSALSNGTQPYPTSQYSIFVAEVASTLNEALLLEHLLATVTDDRTRLSLLGHYLDGVRGTVFRQTQFAEFELAIHETAEGGEALTGDVLSEMYQGITRAYYGHDAGVCHVDPEIRVEWAHVPHFYYTFYVYQYATSFTASQALAEMIMAGEPGARDRTLHLLSAGGADYPIELLRRAGVDMTTAVPFELTMRKMNRIMDEMETLLERIRTRGDGGANPAW